MKKIILGIVIILMLGGAALYFWLSSGGDDGFGFKLPEASSPVAPSPLVAGCGNNLCEESETFSSCPIDCYNPVSSGTELAKLSLAPSDFPPPYQGTIPSQKTSWVKFFDQLVEESYIWPPLKDKGALAIHESIIRLSAPGDLSWDQWGRLEQYILVFPPDKISQAFEAMSAENFSKIIAKEKAELSFQELPNPAIGERSRAFKLQWAGRKEPQYMIVFTKNVFLEYLLFGGEKYEYQVFPPLARKAAEKIK